MLLIDTHNHLGCEAFAADRIQVLNRSLVAGVKRQILIGLSTNEWQALHKLTDTLPSLYFASGYHPLYLPPLQSYQQDLLALEHLLSTQNLAKLCAVGEIGLDYYSPNIDKTYQHQWFSTQLNLANQHQLPVLLHVRRAHADCYAILKKIKFARGGIVHAFTGSIEEALNYIKLGFKIGLGGAGTWPQAHKMYAMIKQLPMEAIVLETDAPDIQPFGRKGQRNSPEFLPEICQQLAQIKGISPDELANASTINACELFRWYIHAL